MRYTKAEDDVIITVIKTDPLNLTRALQIASKMLGNRSYGSVQQRYYNHLRYSRSIYAIYVDGTKQFENTKILPKITRKSKKA